ncbi:hypothetical protein PIROE2DRAFT_7657 [Piromyces sp. E2]|nr:hypothetical protein PIROE2DRAFT_7657 [Piromyces sp. E2]|eukprot:OUM65358.1 hypothetical protein PIROE2DRAFT_7657 [Piromyces sp. E2]
MNIFLLEQKLKLYFVVLILMNKPNKEIILSELVFLFKKLSNYSNEELQISSAADVINNPDYYKGQAVNSYIIGNKDIYNFQTIIDNKPHSIVVCAYLKLLKRFANNPKNCEALTSSEYIDIYEHLFKYHYMDKYNTYIYVAKLFIKLFETDESCILPILKSSYILSRICCMISDKEKSSTQEQQTIYIKLIKLLINNKKYQEIFGNSGIIELLCNDIIKNLAIKIEESTRIEKNEEVEENDNLNNKSLNYSKDKLNVRSSNKKLNKSNNNINDGKKSTKKSKKVTLKETKIKQKSKFDLNTFSKLNLEANTKTLLNEMSSRDSLRSYSMNFNEDKMFFLDYNNFNDLIIELRLDILQNICCLNDVFRHDAIAQNIIPIINIIIKNNFYPLNKQCFFILSNIMLSQDVGNVETIHTYLVSILPLIVHNVTNEYLYLPISFVIRNIIFNYTSIKSKFYTLHGIDAVFDGINEINQRLTSLNITSENDMSFLYTIDNYACILKNICFSSKAPTIKEVLLKYSKRLVDSINLVLNYYYELFNKVTIVTSFNNKKYKNDTTTYIIEGNKLFIYKKNNSDYFQYSKDDYENNVKDKYIEKSNDPFKMIIMNLLTLFIAITNYDNTSKMFYESGALIELLNITKKLIDMPKKSFDIIEKLLHCIENMSFFLNSSQKIFEVLGNTLIKYIYQESTTETKLISLCIIYNIIITNPSISKYIFHLSSGLVEEIITNIASTNNDYRDIAIKIVNFYISQNDIDINEKLCKHGCIEQLSVIINKNNNKTLINASILNMATTSYLKLMDVNPTNPEFCIKMQNEWKQRDEYFKESFINLETNNSSKKAFKKVARKIIKANKMNRIKNNKITTTT